MTNDEDRKEEGQRKLATIMFSDICGYTAMMSKNELGTLRVVKRNLEIHQRLLEKYNGRLIKELGDGLLASFDSPSEAVKCAKEILSAACLEKDLNLHIGIHQGEVIFTKNDVYGDGVNIAARIDSIARSGEILVSEEVWKNIRNKEEFDAELIGKKHLKNVAESIRLFRISVDEKDSDKHYWQTFRRRKVYILKYVVIALVGLMILTAAFLGYDQLNSPTPEAYQSIAILPFKNQTNNPAFDYLSEGLAEDVISQFFHLSAFSVISSRSSFQFKDTDKTIQQLSRALKADLILVGGFSIENDKLNVKVELIEGRTSKIMSYASLNAGLDEVKIISASISKEVFKTIQIPEVSEKGSPSNEIRNVNIEAYKYYSFGKSAMRDNTQQNIDQIIQFFNTAIQLDSTYVDPYIGMAEAYFFDVNRGYMSTVEAIPNIRKYALLSESLKPGSGEVHGILGGMYSLENNFEEAIQHFEKSIQINPNYDFTYQWYAYTLAMTGQFDLAQSMFDKAILLDPLNSFNHIFKALYYVFDNNFAEAQKLLDTNLELNPGHPMTLWVLGIMHLQMKDYPSAYDAFIKREVGMETNFAVGYTYAMLGMDAEAKVVLNNVLTASETKFVPPAQLAILYVGLGQNEKAIDQIEQSFLVHDSWLLWIKYSSTLDPIRQNPRYVAIIDMMNL